MAATKSLQQADHGNLKIVTDNGDGTGSLDVNIDSAALPTGASTEAKQDTQITAEQAIQATAGATNGAAVITDANGTIQQYLRGLVKRWVDALGAGTAAAALRTTLASDDPAVVALQALDNAIAGSELQVDVVAALPTGSNTIGAVTNTPLTDLGAGDYERVAAGVTDQMLGPTGAVGDYLAGLLVIPATTSPGEVSIEDGSTNMVVFTGGATSVSNLVPFFVPIMAKSVSGGWEVSTGSNVSVFATGNFT